MNFRGSGYFSPHPKLPLPEEPQCFAQILTFKWHPWCIKTKLSCDASVKFQELKMFNRRFRAMLPSNSMPWFVNAAFVGGFLQIPKVDDVKMKLSPLLYSTLLYSTLLCSTLFCSTLRYSSLPYSTLFCCALLYSPLLSSAMLCSPRLYSMLLWKCSAHANWTRWSLFCDDMFSTCQLDTMIFVLWW